MDPETLKEVRRLREQCASLINENSRLWRDIESVQKHSESLRACLAWHHQNSMGDEYEICEHCDPGTPEGGE